MNEVKTKNVVTPVARASYAHVHEKSMMPNGVEKYSIALLFPKSDTAGITLLQTTVKACAAAYFANDKKALEASVSPLHDGDDPANSDKGESYKGHFYMNAKSDNAPGIVSANGKPLMGGEEIYSGCYIRASLNFYGYNKGGNKGVGVGLNNLMKVKDGDRLDGRMAAEDEFADFAQEGDTDETFLGE